MIERYTSTLPSKVPFALCMAFILCLCLSPTAKAQEITLVADEWCPYNCDPEAGRPGFMVEIARAAFAEAKIDVAYRVIPWSRAINDVRGGMYEGAIGTIPDEVPDFVFPQTSQAISSMIFVVRKGALWRYTGIDSLSEIRFAAVKDYSYGSAIDEYIAQSGTGPLRVFLTIDEQPLLQNLKMLDNERVDAILVDRDVFRHHVFINNLEGQYMEAGEADVAPLFIAFSPDNPLSSQYARIIDEGMQTIRANGVLARILNRYGLQDWQ